MQKRPSTGIVPSQGGIFQDLTLRVKLIFRLMADGRVNPWLKLIPIAGILYLISPFDVIPDIMLPVIGELDDIAIVWLTNHFFIEFCPPEVVREHVKQLVSNTSIIEEETSKASDGDVVDGEAKDITDRR